MRRTCALNISGVMDMMEAERFCAAIDLAHIGIPWGEPYQQMLDGEFEFYFDADVDLEDIHALPDIVTAVLDEFNLSYCLAVSLDISGSQMSCRVVDRDLGLTAVFETDDGLFVTTHLPPDDPLIALAKRWEEADESPPFCLIRSQHQALAMTTEPGELNSSLKAYFQRRATRMQRGRERESA